MRELSMPPVVVVVFSRGYCSEGIKLGRLEDEQPPRLCNTQRGPPTQRNYAIHLSQHRSIYNYQRNRIV